jgi:hypothetical protein
LERGIVDVGVDLEPAGVVGEGNVNFVAGAETLIQDELFAVGGSTIACEFIARHCRVQSRRLVSGRSIGEIVTSSEGLGSGEIGGFSD